MYNLARIEADSPVPIVTSVSQRADDTKPGAFDMQGAAKELARLGSDLHGQISRYSIDKDAA